MLKEDYCEFKTEIKHEKSNIENNVVNENNGDVVNENIGNVVNENNGDMRMNIFIIMHILIKYLIQGIVIALLLYNIPRIYNKSIQQPSFINMLLISITCGISLLLLDIYSSFGEYAKFGIGVSIGMNLIKNLI